MFGFVPFVMWLFSKYSPRRAALAGFLLGWMFLPDYTYHLPGGLPSWSKTFAASFAVLLSAVIFDGKRFSQFRPIVPDYLMIFWCLTPFFASLSNGLGLYDGFSSAKNYFTAWGAPYLVGRLYFTSWDAVRDLLWGLFLGALIYAPLCWLEQAISPQLHKLVYGFHAHDFIQSIRAIGYRPTVFMQHGLMLGMWMAGGTLAGLILWRWDGTVKKLWGFPMKPLVLGVLVTTIACQSMGALGLLFVGYGLLAMSRKFRTKLPILVFALFPVFFLTLNVQEKWDGYAIADFFRKFSADRAASFEYRVINEEMLVKKAAQRPLFGWGGWGRSRIYNEDGKDISVTDSYWIIVFGTTGMVGLAGFSAILLYPILGFLYRYRLKDWGKPEVARAVPLMMFLVLYFFDCMVNDMKSPVYTLIIGSLANLVATPLAVGSKEVRRSILRQTPCYPRVLA